MSTKLKLQIFLLLLLSISFSNSVLGFSLFTDKDASFSVSGRMQLAQTTQLITDDISDDVRLFLFLKQARAMISGNYGDMTYELQMAFGGEETVKNKNASLGLLDMNVELPLMSPVFLKLGQFKAPYGRERMTDSADLYFGSRSIQNLAFTVGRDVGAALFSGIGNYKFSFGVFTGGGRDIPERYLPEDLGIPMLVLRAGYDTGYDKGVFNLKTANQQGNSMALFANGLYLKNTKIGHSSVLGVKTDDVPLIINQNWNPYISGDDGQLIQAGLDFAMTQKIGADSKLRFEAEGNGAYFTSSTGDLSIFGGRGQVSYQMAHIALSTRYAFIRPSDEFLNSGTAFTGNDLIHELTPSVTYSMHDGRAKFIVDAPILIDVPVASENGLGGYVLTDQPDQISVIADNGGSVFRKTVPSTRILFQMSF